MTSLTRAWPLMMVARLNQRGHEPQGSKSHLLVPPRDEEERRGPVPRAQHLAHFFEEVPSDLRSKASLRRCLEPAKKRAIAAAERNGDPACNGECESRRSVRPSSLDYFVPVAGTQDYDFQNLPSPACPVFHRQIPRDDQTHLLNQYFASISTNGRCVRRPFQGRSGN